MAISTPTERYAASKTSQGASSTFKPDTTVTAGKFVVLVVTSSVDGKVVSSVSDNAGGNTWVVDVAYDAAAANENVSIISCQVATQLTGGGSGTTITVNHAVSTNNQVHFWLQEFTGIATSAAFDKSATGTGNSTTPATGSSGTLSQADELVIAGCRGGLASWAHGSTYSDPATPILGANLSALEYKIVSATTAVTADGSISPANVWTIALATYKGAATGNTYTKAGFATENRVA